MSEINNLLTNISNIKADIKSAIETKGQNVTNFASYPNAISNIVSGGSGGVYRYSSLENMYNDIPNRVNGDFGLVYSFSLVNLNPGDYLTELYFRDEVIFDTELGQVSSQIPSDSPFLAIKHNRGDKFLRFIDRGNNNLIVANFISADNMHFHRDTDMPYIYDFGRMEQVPANINPNALYFIEKSDLTFNNLYQFNGTNFVLANTQLNADAESVYSAIFYGQNGKQGGTLNKITNLNIVELKNRVNLYSNISNLTPLTNDLSSLFENFNRVILPNINTTNVINTQYMFSKSSISNIPNYDFSNVINAQYMFNSCTNLTNIESINLPKAETIAGLFANCNNLIEIRNINTNSITDISRLFMGCKNLINVPELNTNNVTNMAEVFRSCTNLVNIPNYDTNNVTNMFSVFNSCYNLVNAPNWDTSNVTSMQGLFSDCRNLINVPNYNTSNVTNMLDLFSNCVNLANIPNFDTSNVTNMYGMVSCILPNPILTTIPNFNTINVTDMSYMFWNQVNLINVPNFDTSNVTSFYMTFNNCISLVNAPRFNTINAKSFRKMFEGCTSLSDVPQYDSSNITGNYCMSSMFRGCNNLSNASIQNIVNMCLNAVNVPANQRTLNNNYSSSNSPLVATKFNSSYYSNRLAELDAAGWKY